MAQQFQVLRCCSCNIFQVQQVKKSKKWNCKICDEKQSILRVFGQGSGVDCRRHVQKLNLLQGEQDHTPVSKLRCKEESGPIVDENMAVNIKEKTDWEDRRHLAMVNVKSCKDDLCDSTIPVTEDHVLQRNNQQPESKVTELSKWNKFLLSDKSYNINMTGGRQRTSDKTPAAGTSDERATTSSAECGNWHLKPQQNVLTCFDRATDSDHLGTSSKYSAGLATCQDKAQPAEFTTSSGSCAPVKSNNLYGSLFSTGEDFDDDI
ncbi:MRN complex-interacting protein isoform X1 [Pantherophis guttatus]|uniref:MRN complex-interacting protein isoform X1 n=1 Tax=Pantherophis guttatus TaxID=94885 RepID=A0A6P9AS64_PANGU|nr:MRN complex-interacting protein isoform X1 [Pantherophis guttatus]